MYKIIGGDGREYGPVSAAQIEQWIAQNRANARTRVCSDTTSDWRPLGEWPEFAAALATRNAPPPIPGLAVPALPAGAPPLPAPEPAAATGEPAAEADPASDPGADPLAEARACVGRRYRLSILDTLERGWEILTERFWLTVGGAFVAAATCMLAGMLPVVGIVASVALTQVFYAGTYWLMLRVARGEPAELTDVFGGFARAFGPLVRLSLAMCGGTVVLGGLAAGPLLWAMYQSGAFHGIKPDPAQLVGPMLALPVLMIPLLYFSIGWMFAPLLVVDRGMDAWEAMETSRRVINKRWFRMFFLYLAFLPLMLAGLLCFVVGIFVVMALLYASVATAYETAFAENPKEDSPFRG